MTEPTLPAGITITVFIVTIISWYGMLRTGVQLLHDEIAARKSVDEDIKMMCTDLKFQEIALNDWRRKWMITKDTPNEVLLQYWGQARLEIINDKIKRIEADFKRIRHQLKDFAELEEGPWKAYSRARKSLMIGKFVWTKKKYITELIDRVPKNMVDIGKAADSGWDDQRRLLNRVVWNVQRYDIQAAYLLAKISTLTRSDANSLLSCCQRVQDDFEIILDLDIFDVVQAIAADRDAPQIAENFQAGHLKLNLLLRKADRPHTELVRILVERSRRSEIPAESSMLDAFRALLDNGSRKSRFTSDASTLFRCSKTWRAGDPCSKLQQTFREVLADQDPPVYNERRRKFSSRNLVLGEVSTLRAAFELAQAALLFFRTTWLSGLCRCNIKCDMLSTSPSLKWHQFGLKLANTSHEIPLWRSSEGPSPLVEGAPAGSWCEIGYDWDDFNKPLRYLGLLLVELILGTLVIPKTENSVRGAATVTSIEILVKSLPSSYRWKSLNIPDTLKLIKFSVYDSDSFVDAVEYCLTGSFPSSPSDAEWEDTLKLFYYRVVKPYVFHSLPNLIYIDQLRLRELYNIKLESGGIITPNIVANHRELLGFSLSTNH